MVSGVSAWLWTECMSDNPRAGGGGMLTDQQIAEAEKQIDDNAAAEFLSSGLTAGILGLLLSLCTAFGALQPKRHHTS